MEILIFLIVTATLLLLLVNNSRLTDKLNSLGKEMEHLKQILNRLEKPVITQKKNEIAKEPVEKSPDKVKPEPIPQPDQKTFVYQETITSSYEDTVKAKMAAINHELASPEPTPTSSIITPVNTARPPKQPTDFEKFIGENLISKIGIIILVLGVGFFVKYAIDQQWIGVYGRTAIGVLTGGILVSLAHYLRKTFKTFSSLLTGGGFAVFYLTIAIAFHQYHIFSQSVAFVIMILITIFSVMLALAYDKKELAIFSQLGGYAAPFMVSTGNGNYVVLFSYLLILNAGLLVLAYYKRWHILNLLAFIFTLFLFSGWLATAFWGRTNPPYTNAMLFATAFYIVFFLVNILNNIKERKPFKAIEIMMILSNNLFFFLWGIFILHTFEKGIYKGLFTVLTGLFNFGWVLYLYRKKQIDKNLIYLLIALVMSYISLAIPIQLNGHSITLFWTAELVILLWLSQISGIRIMKTGHLAILALVVISLAMDWQNGYSQKDLAIVINQVFITGIFVIAGLSVSLWLMKKEKEPDFVKFVCTTSNYKNILALALFVIAFTVPFLEIIYQTKRFYPDASFQLVVAATYVYAYLFTALVVTNTFQGKTAFRAVYILSWISLFLYLVIFHVSTLDIRFTWIFDKTLTTGNFLFHYLAIPFVIGNAYFLIKKRDIVLPDNQFMQKLLIWFISFLFVFIASAELDNIFVLISANSKNYYSVLQASHKIGYPILWGAFAFMLITLGIVHKLKLLRIQALCLFALILLKLFIFDFRDMGDGGRIASFIFLGIIFLVVSFLYQKLKNLLLNQEDTTKKD